MGKNFDDWKKRFDHLDREAILKKLHRSYEYCRALKQNVHIYEQQSKNTEALHEVYDQIEKRNENLAELLADAGIKPHRLRITYEVEKCTDDECECYENDCCGCDFLKSDVTVVTVSYYDYAVNGDMFEGINKDFDKDVLENIIEVEDLKKGKTIYKRRSNNDKSGEN